MVMERGRGGGSRAHLEERVHVRLSLEHRDMRRDLFNHPRLEGCGGDVPPIEPEVREVRHNRLDGRRFLDAVFLAERSVNSAVDRREPRDAGGMQFPRERPEHLGDLHMGSPVTQNVGHKQPQKQITVGYNSMRD